MEYMLPIQVKCVWFLEKFFTTLPSMVKKNENANETDAWNISHTE